MTRIPAAATLALVILSLTMTSESEDAAAAGPGRDAGAATPAAGTSHAAVNDAFLQLHAETRGFQLGRPVSPKPTPDGKSVLFLRSGPKDTVNALFEYDVQSGKTRELLTPSSLLHGAEEHLSAEEKARRERMRVSTRGFTHFEVSRDGALLLVSLSGRVYAVRRSDAHVEELATGAAPILDPKLSPDGTQVAFVRERDLHVLHLASRVETRLTRAAGPSRSAGLAEFVAQEEMQRFAGYWWSPDGKRIAYQETDESMVEQMHLGDPTHPDRAPEVFRYPRPGRNNASVSLFVVELPAPGKPPATPRAVPWDAAALPYLSQVSWHKGGPLTFVVRSRDQKTAKVLAWDDATGAVRQLLEEHDAAWLNIDKTVPRWLPDGSGFLWSSDTSGTTELQLRRPDGPIRHVLSAKGVDYRGIRHVTNERVVYVGSPESHPEAQRLYRHSVSHGRSNHSEDTDASGVTDAEFAEDGALLVMSTSTLDVMPTWVVLDDHGDLTEMLARANALPSVALEPPLVPKVELTRVGSRDLRAIVIRPRHFDPKKKYPVMVDVYGGPHHQHVLAQLGPQLLRQWIADHGYIVVAIDGRGTPGRGRAFERALKEEVPRTRGSFGSIPLDDQVDGLLALAKTRPEMDLSRVGIYGWSFGGYLAALAVLRRPDVFHVAVAGAPVVDWRDYDTCYTERYLDLPEANPAGYDESSLLTYAGDLKRPLLLIHGTTDDNVYFLHSLKLADALFRKGRDFELLPLEGFTHMVPDPLVRQRLYGRILGTLGRVLKP